MLLAAKLRLYPTPSQEVRLRGICGATRYVYNLGLRYKEAHYKACQAIGETVNGPIKPLTIFDISNELTQLKRDQNYNWLKDAPAAPLQQALADLDVAYKNFFSGTAKYPNRKSKHSKSSFRFCLDIHIKIPKKSKSTNRRLIIPTFPEGIKFKGKALVGKIRNATISIDPDGKFYASVLYDTEAVEKETLPITRKNSIGIDLGIKEFLITSDGLRIPNPTFLKKSLNKLKKLQQKLAKANKKSNKRKKLKLQIARLHKYISNCRKDFLHKLSSKLISENQTICLETLKVKNMIKNHKLARSISDASWSMFIDYLTYKAKWYGVNLLKVPTFYPSSKTCNKCGEINNALKLSDRSWECGNCHTLLDRDLNASINIKNKCLSEFGL